MNPENIVALATMLVAVGGTLSPAVFWAIQKIVKPFVKDGRLIPIYAVVIGGLVGAAVPFILASFGLATVPVLGSAVAGIIGGAIAIKTYDEGVHEGLQKTEDKGEGN